MPPFRRNELAGLMAASSARDPEKFVIHRGAVNAGGRLCRCGGPEQRAAFRAGSSS